jgi:hypothetical protein
LKIDQPANAAPENVNVHAPIRHGLPITLNENLEHSCKKLEKRREQAQITRKSHAARPYNRFFCNSVLTILHGGFTPSRYPKGVSGLNLLWREVRSRFATQKGLIGTDPAP